MATLEVWSAQEAGQLKRFGDILNLAARLVGVDDFLANLLLEDALHELKRLIGERARPIREAT
jgi:hypothetical protein